MDHVDEFHYQLPRRFGGWRPGAQRGLSQGSGQEFAAHRRLFDHADPRRIDLRASVRDARGDWLVRVQRLRVAIPVHVVVDVSASMHFGALKRKLDVVADLVEALGYSAFRAGDAVGLLAFDHRAREDLFVPARHGRGNGSLMARMLRDCRAAPGRPPADANGLAGLRRATERLVGRGGLVFLASDFHWPVAALGELLAQFAPACVVPLLVWDPAETEPPPARALVALSDSETGVRRSLWMRESLRTRWREAVAARRAELTALFDAQGMPAFHLHGRFDAEALTRYFMETAA
ncbi:MxaS protein [Variovorax paradoxus]|nr:MxaS protein [Variovorax paradoxus]